MFGIGVPEFILILVIGLIVFGPGKLPEMARSLGKGMREFKKATNALSQAINEPIDTPPVRPQQQAAAPQPAAQPQPTATAQPTAAQAAPAGSVAAQAAAPQPEAQPAPAAPAYTAPTQESVRQQVAAQQADVKKES